MAIRLRVVHRLKISGAIPLLMYQFITINDTTCIKSAELKTGQHISVTSSRHQAKQNEVLVHSMIVHSMGSHIVYSFNYIIDYMLTYWLMY